MLNFTNYSIEELDAINFIEVYFLSILFTYFAWKINLEYNKPFLINLILFCVILFLILWEMLIISYPLFFAKLIFTCLSCWFVNNILNKIFNN